MKKWIKNNTKLFIGIIIGLILTGTSVYAATIYYNGINVGYDNSTTGFKDSNNQDVKDVQTALDELYTLASNCSSGLNTPFELGNYFTLIPDSSTYTITAGTTGYTSDQTITPNELTLWRVIDIHSDGSVEAVSEYVSSTNVYFQGTQGYANFVGGLQTIAQQYSKAGYTIETRMMGYDGQTLTIANTSAFDGTVSNAPGTTTTPSPYTGTGEEYSGGVLGDTLYLKDIQLVGNVYKTDTTTYGTYGLKAYKVDATTTNGNYWLASRYYHLAYAAYPEFHGRYVSSGFLYYNYLRALQSRWIDASVSSALRPIITLKSGIQITGGQGTKTSPYMIG